MIELESEEVESGMEERTHSSLEELQELDATIEKAEDQVGSFEPQIEEVDEPALKIEEGAGTTRKRLKEIQVEERRLELSADEKRARAGKLKERLGGVRNVREQAAVSAELDMVQRALEGDEQEALTLLDQIRKLEDRLDEEESALEEARSEVEPRRRELLAEREEAQRMLGELRQRRESLAETMDHEQLRTYEGIRGGGRRRAVSTLTPDGACGNCFSVIPLQLQNEIRGGRGMIRCEGCGVILTGKQEAPEA